MLNLNKNMSDLNKVSLVCVVCNKNIPKKREIKCEKCSLYAHETCVESKLKNINGNLIWICEMHENNDDEGATGGEPLVDLSSSVENKIKDEEGAVGGDPLVDLSSSVKNNDKMKKRCDICECCEDSNFHLWVKCTSCVKEFHLECAATKEAMIIKGLTTKCIDCINETASSNISIPKNIKPRSNSSPTNHYDNKRIPPNNVTYRRRPQSERIVNQNFPPNGVENNTWNRRQTIVPANTLYRPRNYNRQEIRFGQPRWNYNSEPDTRRPQQNFQARNNNNNNNNNNYNNYPPLNMDVNYGSDRLMTEIFMRERYKELPKVKNGLITWRPFYVSYQQTKRLFSQVENLNRINAAIEDKEVIKIGGTALYNFDTFEAAIENINRRLNQDDTFAMTQATEILRFKINHEHDYKKIVEYIDKIVDFTEIIKISPDNNYYSNTGFLNNIAKKLPARTYNKWIGSIADAKDKSLNPTLIDLCKIIERDRKFFQTHLEMELLQPTKKKKEAENKEKSKDEKAWLNSINADDKKFNNECWNCESSSHTYGKCKRLWSMDGNEVRNIAIAKRRCLNCGQQSHRICPYKEKLLCKTKEGNNYICSEKHHMLFCKKRKVKKEAETSGISNYINELMNIEDMSIEDSENEDDPVEEDEITEENCNYIVPSEEKLYTSKDKDGLALERKCNSFLAVITMKSLKTQQNIALMIDLGATVSTIDEYIANKEGIKGPILPLTINCAANQSQTDKNSRVIKFPLKNITNGKVFDVPIRTFRDLSMHSQPFNASEFKKKYNHLKELNLSDHDSIHGVLGIDNQDLFASIKFIPGKNVNDPIGVKTKYGDGVFYHKYQLIDIYEDLIKNLEPRENLNYLYKVAVKETEDYEKEYEAIEKHVLDLASDDFNMEDRINYEEKRSLDILKETKKDDSSGKYTSKLLWKEDNIILPTEESKRIALRKFLTVEKILTNRKEFQELEDQVNNLMQKGFARELTEEEIQKESNKTYYNPIFLIKPSGKRGRLIWDMASKIKDTAINDYIWPGPNLYNGLLKIIFQAREYKNLIKADLSEMFHQIQIHDDDTDALRFLFRYKGEKEIRYFKMLVLPFGLICAPTISQYVKNLIAEENEQLHKDSSWIMKHATYVDDIVSSIEEDNKAIDTLVELKIDFLKGGFNMLKIKSDNTLVVEKCKEKLKEYEEEKLFSMEAQEKILGYIINYEENIYMIDISFEKLPKSLLAGETLPTKRQVLKTLMSIFDPIGFAQFITSKLKLLYHKVIKEQMDWDETIPTRLFTEWKKCLEMIKQLNQIKIPRCYINENFEEIVIHAFSDAGKEMLCGILYIGFLNEYKEPIKYILAYAKTWVIPHKQNRTTPEKELQAFVNLIKMKKFFEENHRLKFKDTTYYTDSSTVYEWTQYETRKVSVYTKNRLKFIENNIQKEQIKWVPGELMPADYGTKEEAITEINYSNNWFFPKYFEISDNEKEVLNQKMKSWNYHTIEEKKMEKFNVNFEEHNDITKLIRRYQIILKLCYWQFKIIPLKNKMKTCKRVETEKLKRLLKISTEKLKNELFLYKEAFYGLIRIAQEEGMKYNEKEWIKVKTLNTKRDSNEILKVITRTQKELIWLPKGHRLTRLIIQQVHEQNRHVLKNYVIAKLEKRYWIVSIKTVVKRIIKECVWCQRYSMKRPTIPMMGDLPMERLGIGETPFTYVMADIAGPMGVKLIRNVREKRYIMVYTCLTTRALWLEPLQNMTTDATLQCFNNIWNIRGKPKIIYSDCGTNFVGAANKIKHLNFYREIADENAIEFKFNPAKASNMQGAVEILVGLTKRILKIIKKKENHNQLDDFTFKTLLYETMNILNNRPLVLTKMRDGNYLSPNSFLIKPCHGTETINHDLKAHEKIKEYENMKKYEAFLWREFVDLYIPTLYNRPKWKKPCDNLKEGDLVLTVDTNQVNSWRIGRITKAIVGSNNQVRKLEIRLGKNNPIKTDRKSNILKSYKEEPQSIVTRPASATIKIFSYDD